MVILINKKKITITFSESDYNLAVFLKESLSYGQIYKIKDKKAYNWIIGKKIDVIHFLNLINGHLRTEYKLTQIHENMPSFIDSNYQQKPSTSPLLDNGWLAGFTEAEGCFYTQILTRRKNPEIRLHFKFGLKDNTVLYQLKETFGGSVFKRNHITTTSSCSSYYWSTTSFKAAQKVVIYFKERSLQGSKWLSFLKWHHILLLVLNKKHLTNEGFNYIKVLKQTMNKPN